MKKVCTVSLVLAGLLMATAPLFAHHGRGNAFNMDERFTLTGTVSEVLWRNPHVRIFVDVPGEDGEVVNWSFENTGTANLAQAGYNRGTLKVGQPITAVFNGARNGTPVGIIVMFIDEEGRELMSRIGGGGNPLD
jgi:hypothetical protein